MMPVDQTIDQQQVPYISAFEHSETDLARIGHPWIHQIRRDAIERFSELGFPSAHDEDWKFTNLDPLLKISFAGRVERGDTVRASEIVRRLPGDHYRLVFVNGRYSPSLSNEPGQDLTIRNLRDALSDGTPLLEQHLARLADYKKHGFIALNTAFLEDGAFVYVPRGVIVERPIHLVHVSAAGLRPQASHPRNLIVVDANSQASVIESYIGVDNGLYFTNAVTEIIGGEDTIIHHHKLQRESDQAFHIATLQVEQNRGCTFTSHSIAFGGALARTEVNSVLAEGSECTLNGLYVVSGRQHVDTRTSIDHAKPHAASHELYKGILDGRSSAVFNGKIIVRKDAQKTDAKQTNKNLVLSEDSTINTKPQLQIYADDVRCTHGATVGQLDEDAIFYLRSRGISRETARDILTTAFARDIIDRIKLESLRNYIEQILTSRLARERKAEKAV